MTRKTFHLNLKEKTAGIGLFVKGQLVVKVRNDTGNWCAKDFMSLPSKVNPIFNISKVSVKSRFTDF